MSKQPEKLFREKLENFQMTVPANAWSRVETQLDKKSGGFLYWKVAASVLLLIAAGVVIWSASDTSTAEQTEIARNPQERTKLAEQTIDVPKTAIDSTQKNAAVSNDSEIIAIPKKKVHKPAELPKPELPAIEPTALTIAENTDAVVPIEQTITIETTETPVVAVTAPSEERKGVTLIYTREEVNEKYLDKKALAEATSDDKKPSTLKKLLDKAYDLKNNEDPFGDLREKKNEILALNFKSEKQQRSQNK